MHIVRMSKKTPSQPTQEPRFAVRRIDALLQDAADLLASEPLNTELYNNWCTRCREALAAAFGSDSEFVRRFGRLGVETKAVDRTRYRTSMFGMSESYLDYDIVTVRNEQESLPGQVHFLRDCLKDLKIQSNALSEVDPFTVVNTIQVLRRFHLGASRLRSRPRKEKASLGYVIADEYDVQDLLFAILKPYIKDLDCENPTPKFAGDAGRVDLCSKDLGMVIEVKYGKNAKRAADLAAECRERFLQYSEFPELTHLIYFIYDPNHLIADPDNFEKDFTSPATWRDKSFQVTAIVNPK